MILRRWRMTVRTRTALVAAGVVLVALVAGAFGLVWLVSDHLVAADRSASSLRADDVLALATSGDLPSTLSFPGDENGATQVLDADGVVVAATGNIEGDVPISSLRPADGSSSSEITIVKSLDDGQRYVIVARTSLTTGTVSDPVTVLAATSLESTAETVAALARALLVGLPFLVLVVGLTTRFLVGRALRPVAAITSEVSDITDRGLARRVPEPGTADEIDELAVTMNRMLARLESASARQRRFVADASHELRSPLASARAALEVAALHPGSRESLVAAIEDALIDHDRLDRLARDLLALAKLDGQRLLLSVTDFDVSRLASSLVARRSEGSIDVDVQVARVRTSEHVVTQVLTNLLDNAARFRASSSALRVATSGSMLLLRVDDDGPGIEVADRLRVFEPFTRLDEARSADEGTGLGLAIVAELVAAVGGNVVIEDSPLGGAAVIVSVPI